MKKLIIFDIDGVLLLSKHSFIQLAKNILLNRSFLENKQIDSKLDNFEKVRVLSQIMNNDQLVVSSGLNGNIKKLLESGYLLGVATNRPEEIFQHALEKMKIQREIFSFIHTAQENLSKPNPLIFKEALKITTAENIIFVGNSISYDLKAARSHEPPIDFIAITSLHSKKEFIEAGVPQDKIFSSISAMMKIFVKK